MLNDLPLAVTRPSAIVVAEAVRLPSSEQLRANLAGRTEDQIEILEWFRAHGVARKWDFDELGKRIHRGQLSKPYSGDSIKQVLRGFRGLDVSIDPICKAIWEYRRKVEMRAPKGGFVETRFFKTIREYIHEAHEEERIGFMVGGNSAGKSTSINELDRRDAFLTAVLVPEAASLSTLLPEIAEQRGLGTRISAGALAKSVIEDFGEDDKLVFDEADQCLGTKKSTTGAKTLTWMKRLREKVGASVHLVMDPAGYKRFEEVKKDDALRRIYSRRYEPLFLPAFYPEDLELFAAQKGLPPAPEEELKIRFENGASGGQIYKAVPKTIQDEICGNHKNGLFVWLFILRKALAFAKAEGQEETNWHWVLKAHALWKAKAINPNKGTESEGLK